MSVIQELQDVVAGAAEAVGPSVVGLGRGWGRGSGVVTARRRRPHQRARAARRGGGGGVRRRAHRARAGRRRRRGPRPRGDRGGHRRRAGRRVGPRAAGCGRDRRAGVRARQPRRARACARRSGMVSATGRSFRGPRGRRIGGSLEHTAPLPRGSSGGPLVDGEHRLLGLNSIRLEGGLILALPADAAMQRRAEALAAGKATERPRLGIAHRARARRAADARGGRAARARRPAGARGRRRTAPRRRPASSAATCSWASTGSRCPPSMRCSMPSRRAARLTLDVLRGTEERDGRDVPLQ